MNTNLPDTVSKPEVSSQSSKSLNPCVYKPNPEKGT